MMCRAIALHIGRMSACRVKLQGPVQQNYVPLQEFTLIHAIYSDTIFPSLVLANVKIEEIPM